MIQFADGFRSRMILRFMPKEPKGGIAIFDMERLVVVVVVVSAGGGDGGGGSDPKQMVLWTELLPTKSVC